MRESPPEVSERFWKAAIFFSTNCSHVGRPRKRFNAVTVTRAICNQKSYGEGVISNWKLLFPIAINKQTNKIFLYYEGSRNTERIWASKRPKKHWGWAQNMMYVTKYKMKVVEGGSCSWTLMIFKSSNLGLDSPIKTDHKFTITRHRMRNTAYRK